MLKSSKVKKVVLACLLCLLITGCSEADRVSYNLSEEADAFNVARKLTVINVRTDTILYQITGNFSIDKEVDGDLAIIGEDENGLYYKHFVCLTSEITYVCEDLGSTGVSRYKYVINFNPKMAFPVFDTDVID